VKKYEVGKYNGAIRKPNYLVPITPENYKFIEETAVERGNISIEECFNNLMELDMMRCR
jgi:hypothetical protein